MQPLARDGLTAAQVTALLHSDDLTVSAGLELLKPNLTVAEDISDDLEGGSVALNLNATIHRTCTLRITRPLLWGIDLVRPYMVLAAEGNAVRFNVGVFSLTTPERRVGETPETYEVTGADRLLLLNRQIGATYTVTAGTTYRAALEAVFTASGLTGALIEGAAADSTVPKDRVWPLIGETTDPDNDNTPVTYLRVVNDLLRAINFRAVFADADGVFRCSGYQEPTVRPVEFQFDADSLDTPLEEDRTVTQDVWAVPNRWVFRWTNAPDLTAAADLVYEFNLPNSDPMSRASRGLTWTSVVDYEAASRAKLVELGDRRVATDRRVQAQYDVTVGPFPCAGHADVYLYSDAAAGVLAKVQCVSWDLDLLGEGTTMRWEAVT